jgi:hypothetical protein
LWTISMVYHKTQSIKIKIYTPFNCNIIFMLYVLWYTSGMVRKLSFLCLVFCDIPMEWCINYYFYALCFVIYQWNGSQIIIFMLYVLWYTSGMVRKLSFLCLVFCDIPMEWCINYYFYALCFVMVYHKAQSIKIIIYTLLHWYITKHKA